MGRQTAKHKQADKHSLGYDIFFKGKKEKIEEQDELFTYETESFDYSPGTIEYDEVYDNERYIRERKLKEMVYEILIEKTDISFEIPRRKPPRDKFNNFFAMLIDELKKEDFTYSEIFNEFAHYFSDNLFSMLKLLDNEYRNLIIEELHKHVGKQSDNVYTVNKKNLKNGSEIEFIYCEDNGIEKQITGIIIGYDHLEDLYKIDSFENIYLINMESICKILNTPVSKYNLNKLDNIDFL